jgi:pullulanase/glycogen debranching enzyme
MRKAHPAFRMRTAAEARENLKFYEELGLKVEPPAIAYMLYGGRVKDSWERIVVLINPEKTAKEFALPMGKWQQVFGVSGLAAAPGEPLSGTVTVEPLSLAVFKM